MNNDKTQVFDIVNISKHERNENPFNLTPTEEEFVKRSLPAFLKSAVKYSSDLNYNLIDFRKFQDCFEIPYKDGDSKDSYSWRVNAFLFGEDNAFTRSCNTRGEMVDIRTKLLAEDAQVSSNLLVAVDEVSQTFYDIITDFYKSSSNVKYRVVDGAFVDNLIVKDRMPQNGLNQDQTLYCCEIIRDAMYETQSSRNELALDLEREEKGM